MRRVAVLVVCCFLLWGFFAVEGSEAAAETCFTFPDLNGNQGSQVAMGLEVSNADSILAVEATVTYPAGILSVVSVDNTSFTNNMYLLANTGTPGVIRIAMACSEEISGNGELFVITFSLTGSPGQVANVSLTEMIVNDSPSGCINNGSITVNGGTSAIQLVADFGASGLWFYDSGTWEELSSGQPDNMVYSAETATLYVDFGTGGLWQWDGSNLTNLSWGNPENMVVSGSMLYVDFGAGGLWKWDGSVWTMLSLGDPENMVAEGSILYVVFGAGGLWRWDGAWT